MDAVDPYEGWTKEFNGQEYHYIAPNGEVWSSLPTREMLKAVNLRHQNDDKRQKEHNVTQR